MPTYSVTSPRSDRGQRTRLVPTFPGYLFARFTTPFKSWPFALPDLRGVVRSQPLLKFGLHPYTLTLEDIERIKAMVAMGFEPVEVMPKTGDQVVFRLGKLRITGILRIDDQGRRRIYREECHTPLCITELQYKTLRVV